MTAAYYIKLFGSASSYHKEDDACNSYAAYHKERSKAEEYACGDNAVTGVGKTGVIVLVSKKLGSICGIIPWSDGTGDLTC